MTEQFGAGGIAAGRRPLVWTLALAFGGLAIGCGLLWLQTAGSAPVPARTSVDGTVGKVAVPAALVAEADTGPTFPLAVEPGKRYLVDARGKPFLIHGDTAWGLITQLSREEVDQYLDDRRARGFNTILVMLITTGGFANAPANAYGQEPFLVPGDYSTPNETYFAHADWVLRRAAKKRFLVLLAPSYVGPVKHEGSEEGWYRAMGKNGPQRLRQYGEYLGRRYRDFADILWVHGGDDNPPKPDLVSAIAEGIRKFDTRALHTVEGAPNTAALDYWQGEPWLQLNAIYNVSEAIYGVALQQYARPQVMPFFLIESAYENAEIYEATERHIRTQAYHTVLSGAAGQIFGNNPIWHFDGRKGGVVRTLRSVARAVVGESATAGRIIDGREPDLLQTITKLVVRGTWQQALSSPGAQSMTHLRDLLMSVPWWSLEPDADNTLLTDGLSTGFARAVAARADDHSFAILYLPSRREITVDLGQLAGPSIAAHWYDPANGQWSDVDGSPFPAAGSQQFVPAPVDNSSGFDDWVLVLRSVPLRSVQHRSRPGKLRHGHPQQVFFHPRLPASSSRLRRQPRSGPRRKRIGVFGLFGCGNSGNDATLESMLIFLRHACPNGELVCICGRTYEAAERIARDYQVAAIPLGFPTPVNPLLRVLDKGPSQLASLGRAVWHARNLDVLIVPGTGILGDFQSGPCRMPAALFAWCLAARLCGTKIALVSMGAGPILHPISRWLIRAAAAMADYRSYRGLPSKSFMEGIGLDTGSDPVYPDLVFRLPSPLSIRQRDTDNGPLTIGVGVIAYRGWRKDSPSIYAAYLEKITRFVVWLLEHDHSVRILTGDRADRNTIDDLVMRVASERPDLASDRLLVEPVDSLHGLMRQIAETDVVVATRFHNVVCALKLGKPTVSIGYGWKNNALMAEMGLARFCQHIERLDVDLLIEQLTRLISDRPHYQQSIRDTNLLYRERLDHQDALLAARFL